MAVAAHKLRDFLAQKDVTDFARANRYEVIFNYPKILQTKRHYTSQGESLKIISLMAEEVLFPGLILGTRAYRLNNLNEQRATVIDFGGDSINFTFLCDASWTAKDFFGDWMRMIVDPVTRHLVYPADYYAKIDIYALNKKDEVIVHWEVQDAFPRSIAPISASASNTEVLRLPVTFAYKKWRVMGGYDPEGNPLSYSNDSNFTDPGAEDFEQNIDEEIARIQDETEEDTIV
jgi:hypothetical protein